MATFPWYEVVQSPNLEQGDIFEKCPVAIVEWDTQAWEKNSSYQVKAKKHTYPVIVLTQSCDLSNNKIDSVLVCPIYPVEKVLSANYPKFTQKETAKFRESIRQGFVHGYHMVAACDLEGWKQSSRLVTFHQVYSVPFKMLQQMAQGGQDRLRLLPPYREHLAQAFARYFLRVGLPDDIPRQDQ